MSSMTTKCMDCGTTLTLQVCSSAAGYYLGFQCDCCGPYSRETGYMTAEKAAWILEDAVENGGPIPWRVPPEMSPDADGIPCPF